MDSNVTIILPTYCKTSEKVDWFEEALASAYSQAHVVVYDDASPLEREVKEVVDKYEGVKFIRANINRGVSYARNRAVELADTELIFPLDCDDKLSPIAVPRLLLNWNGTPVYPDVMKWTPGNSEHYNLYDFNCENVNKYVGISSVGVLHSKEQWKDVGGWDESLNLFEDALYNAKLMKTFCGIRFGEPLYYYRVHSQQKTSIYSRTEYKQLINSVQDLIRRIPMACPGCRGRRSNVPQSQHNPPQALVSRHQTLPGEQNGMVLAQYLGGEGKGPHYYRGHATNNPYKVKYGQTLYVDPRDTRLSNGDPRIFLVRIQGANEDSIPETQVTVSKPQPIHEQPKETPNYEDPVVVPAVKPEVGKTPQFFSKAPEAEDDVVVTESVVNYKDDEYYDSEIDPNELTVVELKEFEIIPEEASWMLEAEKQGRNRKSAISYLEEVLAGDNEDE